MITVEKDKKYLVKGGSGFLGEELISRLLEKGAQIRTIARNEGNLIKLKQKFPSVEIYPGDISCRFFTKQACDKVEGIFHLAAFKHVGLAEKHTKECVDSNLIGSMNILQESLGDKIKFVIGISTDKAAQVAGVYGATKLLMERLFHQYEKTNANCKYRTVRYGNILYSTGSVLCKWKDLIQNGKEVTITEPEATRFFWTIQQAVDLIEECMEKATDSSTFAPNMKSMKIKKLLEAMIKKYSNGKNIPIKSIGLQVGENLHEAILEQGPYSNEVEEFSTDEIIELI